MTSTQEPVPGHEWLEASRVTEYVERMDLQQDARNEIFTLMAKLTPGYPDAPIRMLDIGSGYGPVAAGVLDNLPNATCVALDISDAMMDVGRERMARFGDRFKYVVGDFADGTMPKSATAEGPFNLVVSARAIHHLSKEMMKQFYGEIFKIIEPDGAFFNLDTASPVGERLEQSFREAGRGAPRPPQRTPREASVHDMLPHHKDATLARHMEWLEAGGFTDVECFWKKLGQALVGGYKLA
jgi:tRNA (cmo5U34)-methyltransferase